jgi:hypothetical protein
MNMTMSPIKSSQIEAVGYDAASKTLAVKFVRGTTYSYRDVPAETYTQMMAAESIGKFFGQNIKNLPFEKYEAPAEEPAAA